MTSFFVAIDTAFFNDFFLPLVLTIFYIGVINPPIKIHYAPSLTNLCYYSLLVTTISS